MSQVANIIRGPTADELFASFNSPLGEAAVVVEFDTGILKPARVKVTGINQVGDDNMRWEVLGINVETHKRVRIVRITATGKGTLIESDTAELEPTRARRPPGRL